MFCSVVLIGGQPRTRVVIIYLQVQNLSLFFVPSSYSEDAPTIVWVAHSWGLPVPLQNVSILTRHCGTFKALFHI